LAQVKRRILEKVYKILLETFGPRGWWPGETPFEVIIGAILTQNTSWKNVEKSIDRLKAENLLHPAVLYKIKDKKLAELIKSSGYYHIKTKRIKNFMAFLQREYRGNLKEMFREETIILRKKLLSISGIGSETADSILLYAGEKPTFVVDTYTKRIFSRHGWISNQDDYEDIRNLFMENMNNNVKLFNEYHALLVHLGKEFCKKEPRCKECPLRVFSKKSKTYLKIK
jgi:endonuclease-3 related protein